MDTLSKACSRCQVQKPASAFNKNKTRKFGLSAECKECIAIRSKADRLKHPEKFSARNKKYSAIYAKKHPEKYAQYTRKRRASKASAISERYTNQDILDTWGTDCHICLAPVDLIAPRVGPGEGLHLDHVIPLSKGGNDTISNVKPSHGRCNMSKKDSIYSD